MGIGNAFGKVSRAGLKARSALEMQVRWKWGRRGLGYEGILAKTKTREGTRFNSMCSSFSGKM